MSGMLAVWTDCAAGQEAAFDEWYTSEHLPERMSLPGFELGRRYEALEAALQHLTTYEVTSTAVLTSEAYRARLDAPTTATRRIMRDAFRNTTRAVCARYVLSGRIRGAIVVTITSQASDDLPLLHSCALEAVGCVHAESWIAEPTDCAKTSSTEGALRGEDGRIGACLSLEFLRAPEALEAAQALRAALPDAAIGTYRQLCELRGGTTA